MSLLSWFLDLFRRNPSPEPDPAPGPLPDSIDETLRRLADRHNQHRKSLRLSVLAVEPRLQAAAQKQADWCAKTRSVTHRGRGGSPLSARLREEGYAFRAGGENVAAGQRTVEAVFQAWLNSSGHRINIEASVYSQFGLGLAYAGSTPYWCVTFGSPARSPAIGAAALTQPPPVVWTPPGIDDRDSMGSGA